MLIVTPLPDDQLDVLATEVLEVCLLIQCTKLHLTTKSLCPAGDCRFRGDNDERDFGFKGSYSAKTSHH